MKLFDFQWYAQYMNRAMTDEQMLKHYHDVGRHRSFAPTPYFDPNWYVNTSSYRNEDDLSPLEHFSSVGLSEMSDPHPLFNSKWYNWSYMGDDARVHPLIDYIENGWLKGNNPHPLFWGKWYRENYLKDKGQLDPFYHFLTEGYAIGCNPNPLFDIKWYTDSYGLSDGVNGLIDYIYGGHVSKNPHPLFDSNYYRSIVDCQGLSPLEHYFSNKILLSPTILFDVEFFERNVKNKDIYKNFEKYPALVAYIEISKRILIDPHPMFSVKYYLDKYPDVKQAGMEPLSHYVRSGFAEGRQPHPLFEPDYYWEQFPERRNLNPLIDYLSSFEDDVALPRRLVHADTKLRPLPPSRKVVNISPSSSDYDHNFEGSIGVFAHIFYSDLSEYVVSHTNNIPYDCTIYISTTTVSDSKIIYNVFSRNSKHPFVIRVVANRGRDIAPMLVAYRDVIRHCDYALHIHTKKSKHYDGGFDRWREYLFKSNLGSSDLVRSLLKILSRSEIGAVTPDHFPPIKPLIQWGGNFDNAKNLLRMVGENLSDESVLDLPSGSMFWFKPKAIDNLLNLELRNYHFDPEKGQVDGTLAHAIERSFYYFIETSGFEWVVHSDSAIKKSFKASFEITSIGNRFFPTDKDLGLYRKYYPECTEYLIRGSDIEKPRINLLIPLIDQSKGYAGIATAVEIFMAIQNELKDEFDARIITTDVSIGNQYIPPNGFEIASPFDVDIAGRNTVIDAARRYNYPIFFRKKDILLATAWWTASGAINIIQQQEEKFHVKNKFLYLIQDFESGFYPWSTKYALAERTYKLTDDMVPIFNTGILKDYFIKSGIVKNGYALEPGINVNINAHIKRNLNKDKIVLLYARPHAERNCLPFLDMLIKFATEQEPEFWQDWRFIAIGETFDPTLLRCTDRIETLGRLSLAEYGDLASRSALAVSLMISPHPSYPPLELANAGVKVLTNNYDNKNMSLIHDNITGFDIFDLVGVSDMLKKLADNWIINPMEGWSGKGKIDWFFDERTNLENLVKDLAIEIRDLVKSGSE